MLCHVTQEDYHGTIVYSEHEEITDIQYYAVYWLKKLHEANCPTYKVCVYCADGTSVDITRQAAALYKIITFQDLFHYEK